MANVDIGTVKKPTSSAEHLHGYFESTLGELDATVERLELILIRFMSPKQDKVEEDSDISGRPEYFQVLESQIRAVTDLSRRVESIIDRLDL